MHLSLIQGTILPPHNMITRWELSLQLCKWDVHNEWSVEVITLIQCFSLWMRIRNSAETNACGYVFLWEVIIFLSLITCVPIDFHTHSTYITEHQLCAKDTVQSSLWRATSNFWWLPLLKWKQFCMGFLRLRHL